MEALIRIEKLVYGGDALGRLPDGRAVFVPFALPGELVHVEVPSDTRRFARGKLLEIIQASPQRIAPPCPHFGVCGGCHYQMLDYPSQLAAKAMILQEQLERLGGITITEPIPVTPSPKPFAYRNQVQFHPCPGGILGMMPANGKMPFPVQTCLLPMDGITETWPLLDLGEESELSRVSFREDSRGELLALLEGQDAFPPELETDLPISIVYKSTADEASFNMAGEDSLLYELKGKELIVSADSFFQVNQPVAEAMVETLLSLMGSNTYAHILELYSGVGLFSAFLAERCQRLTAIESSPSACYDFVDNLSAFEKVTLYEGAVEALLPALVDELDTPDFVLLDPPRAGLHAEALKALIKLQPAQIVYISCDPSSLARDLKALLAAGYALGKIQAFDMFPQTYHIETVVLMSRKDK